MYVVCHGASWVRKIQVFLREDQKAALKSLSARTGVRQSDLVRQGVDLLLEGAARRGSNWREATRMVAGVWRDHDAIDRAAGDLRKSIKKRFPTFYGQN
jgi:hypothetical protein